MQSIEEITASLKETLSDIRFRHTIGVAETARTLAEKWGADPDSAYLAGLVHDCAKEIPVKQMVESLEKHGYICDEMERQSPNILHAPLGSILAGERYGVEDTEVLDAVRYHTTGRVDMSLLEKIIYVADFIEPGRKYKEVQCVRDLAFKDIDKAVLKEADIVIKYIIDKGGVLHTESVRTRNSFLIKVKKEEANAE